MLTKRFTKAKILPLFFWFEVVEVPNLVSFSSSAPLELVVAVRVLMIQLSMDFKTNNFFSTVWEIQQTVNLNQQRSSPQPGRFNKQ